MKHKLAHILVLLSIVSCNPEKSRSNQTDNTTSKEDDYLQYEEKVQGEWKRQSYPYGSIVFKGKQVKFIDGEGSVGPAQFKNYFISKPCIAKEPSITEEQHYFGLNTGNNICQNVLVNGDALILYIDGTTSSIDYKKINITN